MKKIISFIIIFLFFLSPIVFFDSVDATTVTYYFNSKSTSVWTNSEYMIDNILTNYATTSSGGATELLDGNTCPANDIGMITKVELRVYAYGDGGDRIDLIPVFGGVDDGDTHETIPDVDPDWGVPQDITTDTNNPSPWSWSDIQNLGCKVEYVSTGKANLMYCSKVEIIVTFAEPPFTYLYVAGGTTQKVWKILTANMLKVDECADDYGDNIWALTEDADYIYCSGATTRKVWKIQKSDMSKVGESADYGGTIYALTEDTDYIYCSGATTRKVWKIQKSDMVKVDESDNYGGSIWALTEDTDYIYCSGTTTRKVWKIQKSDMVKVDECADVYGGSIYALTEDADYIYASGTITQKVWKIQKSDMSKVDESDDYGGTIRALADDDDYVYCGGYTTQKVWKIQKSDMVKSLESTDYGGAIWALAEDDDYVYCGGNGVTNKVWMIQKSDMVKSLESTDYGGIIYALSTLAEVPPPPDVPTQSAQKIWNATTEVEKALNTTDVDLYPTSFNVTINDPDGDKMNITILTNESGSWLVVNQTSDSGLSNGTYSYYNTSWVDTYGTKYWISFNVTDGTNWCNETYHFTTESENTPPTITSWNADTESGATSGWDWNNNDLQVDWIVADDDSDTLTLLWTFSKGGTPSDPTTGSYNGRITGIESGSYSMNNQDLNWDSGDWSNYRGTVNFKFRLHDGIEYSTTIETDTLAQGIDGTDPDTTIMDQSDTSEDINSIWGTATDTVCYVDHVDMYIKNTTDGTWWIGDSWSTETWLSASANDTFDSSNENWNYDSSSVTWNTKNYEIGAKTTDESGRYDSTPATDTFTITITIEPPEFVDSTTDTGYTGDNFIFDVNVTSNEGTVDTVWVDYYYNAGEHTNVSMNHVSDDWYSKTIVIPHSLDTLNYSFSANDTENNWNSTSVVEVIVYDNDNPVVSNVQTNPSLFLVDGYINIVCTATDNIELNVIFINITYPNGSTTNISMDFYSGDIYYNLTNYSQLGIHDYFIWCNDSSGNDYKTSIYHFTVISPIDLSDICCGLIIGIVIGILISRWKKQKIKYMIDREID